MPYPTHARCPQAAAVNRPKYVTPGKIYEIVGPADADNTRDRIPGFYIHPDSPMMGCHVRDCATCLWHSCGLLNSHSVWGTKKELFWEPLTLLANGLFVPCERPTK